MATTSVQNTAMTDNTGANTFANASRYTPPTGTIAGPLGKTAIPSPYVDQPSSQAPTNNYSVVTSKPATSNLNNIQTTYQNTIAPAVANSTATTANNTAAANQVPVTTGFNPYTTTKTGNPGEVSTTANGQTYYSTPAQQPLTADGVKNMLSGPDTSNPAPTTGGAPALQTPTQTAQASTGINPTAENANYQGAITQENDVISQGATSFQNIINSLSAGSIPFTPAQQSLIDATNSAFQQMTTNANLKAAALSSETGGVSNMTNAMGGQLIGIAADQAAAIAKMEVGFQQENFTEKYNTVTKAYEAFTNAETAKMNTLTKIHDSVMTTYQNAVSAAQAQQTFNESQMKDIATINNQKATLDQNKYEFRDLKDEMGTTIGTQVFDKATGTVVGSHYAPGQTNPSTGVTTPTVVTNPNTGAADVQSQAAYLATVPKPYQALVQGIANGKIEPPSARTAMGAKILSMVAQYDPTLSDGSGGFDATKYAARLTMQKSLANYTSGSYGSGLISANKVIAHLESFLSSSESIPGTGAINPLNINKLTSGILEGGMALLGNTSGQQSQASAEQEARGLTDEMTKFFKGTGGTDVESLKSWGSSLNPNASPGTQRGVIQGTLSLFSGQLNAFIQQYTTVMGHAPDIGTVIQPQTMQKLSEFKNAGYQIDIPGVYYTDKNAYLSNGGSPEALTSAYKTLQSHGIPTTPENILQAAQVLNE